MLTRSCLSCLYVMVLVFFVTAGSVMASEGSDHRIEVVIDTRTKIVSPESGLKIERAMLGMLRHPDGSILLSLQTLPVLLRSTDDGRTWGQIDVRLPGDPHEPIIHGLGVSRDGRVWLMHQTGNAGKDLYVSVSQERGGSQFTWTTTQIDYAQLAPNRAQPYLYCYNDYNTFFQRPNGEMVLGIGLRYEGHEDYQQEDQSRPGFHETLIRSSDGGETWGDPTEVHAHVAEACYTVDPRDPDHILAMTRKQRPLLRGEDPATVAGQAGVSVEVEWPWKGALLVESRNGGRTFHEVADSYLGYYSHRGTMLWTNDNVIVAPHTAAGKRDYRLVVNISLDGGQTWVDGTESGTSAMNHARDFVLTPYPPGFNFTTPTVQISRHRFLTVHCYGQGPYRMVGAVSWHIETLTE